LMKCMLRKNTILMPVIIYPFKRRTRRMRKICNFARCATHSKHRGLIIVKSAKGKQKITFYRSTAFPKLREKIAFSLIATISSFHAKLNNYFIYKMENV
jgi:hypothetical protein